MSKSRIEKLLLEGKTKEMSDKEFEYLKWHTERVGEFNFVKKRPAIEKYKDYDLNLKNTMPRV